ncbi:RNA polymerase sigma factor SigF, partial [Streptomyces cinereoruber]
MPTPRTRSVTLGRGPEVAGNPGASMRRAALDGLPELTRPTTVSTDDAQHLSAALLTRLAEL